MDMAALFGDISAGLSAQFGGPYHAGTVFTLDEGGLDDDGVFQPGQPSDPIACMIQVDSATEAMRQAEGYTEQDRRMLVLASPVIATITTDHRVSITEGPFVGAWMIASVARDPFAAYWELRGRAA